MVTLDFMSGSVEQNIRDLLPRMKALTLEALSLKADELVLAARGLCPVRTGALQSTIRKEVYDESVLVIAGGAISPSTGRLVDYAAIVEAKNPFMFTATVMVTGNLGSEIERFLESQL